MGDSAIVSHRFRDLTYPHLNLNDHTLDENLPAFQSELKDVRSLPAADAGDLDTLPVELLYEVMSQLDLRTLVDLRCVNRRATELVDSHTQFKVIIRHAHNALRGILAIETGRLITCGTFYEKLCTYGCEQCGDFGGYLYLFSCKRVCFLCFSRERLYLPLTQRHATRKFGLEPKIVEKLPCMKVVGGIYSPNEKKVHPGVLVDYQWALHAGIARHGSLAAMHDYVSAVESRKLQAYRKRATMAAEQPGSVVRRPVIKEPFDGHSGNPLRFVAIACVPWMNPTSQEVDWGFHCIAGERSSHLPLHYRRKFTADSFDDHLRVCGNIRNGAHQQA